MTPPEVKLWQILRSRPCELKFRRQHPVGPYIADFYCPNRRLIFEVDGVAHEMGDNPARDGQRDEWLRKQGYTIIRIPAAEVLKDVDAVLISILRG